MKKHFQVINKIIDVNNADLIYKNKRLYLVSRKKDILPGEEIFYPYRKNYSRKEYIS